MVATPNNKMLTKSEDDDGYCSRSSLDSPVQVVRMDLEVVETDGSETSAALLSPSLEINFNQNSEVVTNQNLKISENDLGEVMVTEGSSDCTTQVIRNTPGKPVFILNCTKESNLSFCLPSNLKVSTGMALPKSPSDIINLEAIPQPDHLINGASENINSSAQQDGRMTNADDDQQREMEFESCCHGNGDSPAVDQSSETMMDQKQILCDHEDECRKQVDRLPEAGIEQLPTPAVSASSIQQPIWSSSIDDVISVNNELKSDEGCISRADVSAGCVVGQSLKLLGSCSSIGPEIRSASPAIVSSRPCVLKTVRFVGKKLTDGLQSDNVKTDVTGCTDTEVHDVQRPLNTGGSLFVRDRHGTAYYKRVVNLSAHSKNVYLVGPGNKGLNQITQVVKNSELKSSQSSPALLGPETRDSNNVNFKIMTVIPKFRNVSGESLSGVKNRVLAVNHIVDTNASLYSNVATKLNETTLNNPACTNVQQPVLALNSGARVADGSAVFSSFGSSLQEKRSIQTDKRPTDIEYVGSTSLINSPTVIPKKIAESSGPVRFVSNKAKFSPYETKNSKKTSSTSARTGNPYVRGSKLATPHSDQMSSKANYVGRFELHPLIDHDYCKFSAFNAEIQSGIILMSSESGSRFDRQNLRKGKGTVRSKMQPSVVDVMEHKRKYNKRKITSDESNSEIGEDQISKCATPVGGRLRAVKVEKSLLKQRTIADKIVPVLPSSEDKNYVKIPGCYQNEYVYYATTRSVGRNRKRMDVPTGQTTTVVDVKPPTTTSLAISAFDWYKEMAHTDKSSKFGDIDVKSEEVPLIDETPVSESDVADLVMQLLPKTSLEPCQVDKFRSTDDSFLAGSLAIPNSSVAVDGDSLVDMNHVDLNQMAEEIRNMFNSMGEAELKLLETHLERSQDGLQDISCLSDFNRDNFSLLTSSNSNLLDVDEINDGDLLTADIGSMNVILNDLTSPTRSGIALSNDTPMSNVSRISNLTNLFDKVESCSDGLSYNSSNSVDSSDVKPEIEFSSTSAETLCPPELTTVSMFWNDLPGLLMGGKEYVRLVDIHKQIMPAKDTGILKKRCHMMGLEVANCSELQRDFLIRYMNAAKSKSKVVITKDTAIMLIGFYVNPKSRSSKSFDELQEEDFFCLKPDYFPRGSTSSEDPLTRVPGRAGSQLNEQLGHLVKMPLGGPSVEGQAGTMPYKSREEAYSKKEKSLVENEGVVENKSSIPPVVDPHSEVKRSERLRHKHVSYSDMLHGSFGIGEKERAEKSTNLVELKLVKTPKKGRRSRWREAIEHRVDQKRSICKRSKVRRNLAKLLKKQKNVRRGLKEKRWLSYRKDDQRRGGNKASVTTGRPLHRTVQTRMSSLNTVAPEEIKKWGVTQDETKKQEMLQDETKKRGATHDDTKKRGLVPGKYRKRGATQDKTDGGVLPDETCDQGAKNACKRDEVFHTKQEHCYAAAPAGGDQREAVGDSRNLSVEESSRSSIPIRHCDWTRRRSQDGDLFVEMYRTVDSKCIRCCSCRKFVSIAEFLEHLHSRRHDKMPIVLNPQKLFLRGLQKSTAQLVSWQDFKSKRIVLERESRQTAQSEMFAMDDLSVEVKQEAVESTELKNPPLEFHSVKSESSKIEELSENEVKTTEVAEFKEAQVVDLKTCKSEIPSIESDSDAVKLQATESEVSRLEDQTPTQSKTEHPSLNLRHPKRLVSLSGSPKKNKLENLLRESKQKLVDLPEIRRTRQSDSKKSDVRSKLLNKKKIMSDKKLPTRHSERVVNQSNPVSTRRSTKPSGDSKRSNNGQCSTTSVNKLSNSSDVGRCSSSNRYLFVKTRGRPTGRPRRK